MQMQMHPNAEILLTNIGESSMYISVSTRADWVDHLNAFLQKFVNKTSFKNKDSESLHALSYYLEYYLVKFALTMPLDEIANKYYRL